MFAYGDTFVRESCCPARKGGYAPHTGDESASIAETYDDVVRAQTGEDEGVIPKDMAKEMWEKTIQQLRDRAEKSTEEQERKHYESKAIVAEEIMEKAF